MSYARGDKLAFSSINDLTNLELNGKTPILCSQTTENLETFEKINSKADEIYEVSEALSELRKVVPEKFEQNATHQPSRILLLKETKEILVIRD